ncbi:MAG: cyclic nucleotide-binding domain-containing protein [Deltaproteobacteria bacterium]|nr:cyclic nucleotide-binding domain-containing protein [Deltaproteobacteria bacterium]
MPTKPRPAALRLNRSAAPPRLRTRGAWAQLRGLDSQERARLVDLSSPKPFAAGDLIIHPNDAPEAMSLYWVESGEVAVCDLLRSGFLGMPVYLPEGAVIGEAVLAPEVAPRVEVRAATAVTVRELTRDRIAAAAEAVPELATACRELARLRRHRVEMVRSLRHLPLLAQGSISALLPLATHTQLRTLSAGQKVFDQGSPTDGIYFVAKGRIDLTEGRERRRVAARGPGQFFGNLGLVGGGKEIYGAHAATPSEVLKIPTDALMQRLAVSAGFRRAAGGMGITTAAGETILANEYTQVVAFRSHREVNERTALLLLGKFLSTHYHDDVVVVEIDPSAPPDPPVRAPDDAGTFQHIKLPLTPDDRGLALLRRLTNRLHGYEYCLLVLPRSEPAWLHNLQPAISRVLYLTPDTLGTPPRELQDCRVTWCADLRRDGRETGPSDRPGVVRLDLDFCDGLPARCELDDLDEAQRATIGRWARATSERRIGLGLGGGGAWGYAHIPLLRRIHAAGIPIDLVAGASFGALAGAFWCAEGERGLEKLVALGPRVSRTAGLSMLSSSAMANFVNTSLNYVQMAKLPTPFFAVATDVSSCRQAIISAGSIGEAVRASSAFPGITTPVLGENFRHVDGGIIQNVPVDALIVQRADLVIASNIVARPAVDPVEGRTARAARLATRHLPSAIRQFLREFNPIGRVRDLDRSSMIMMHTAGDTGSWSADLHFESVPSKFGMGDFSHGAAIADENDAVAQQFVGELQHRWNELVQGRGGSR